MEFGVVMLKIHHHDHTHFYMTESIDLSIRYTLQIWHNLLFFRRFLSNIYSQYALVLSIYSSNVYSQYTLVMHTLSIL